MRQDDGNNYNLQLLLIITKNELGLPEQNVLGLNVVNSRLNKY